jgi:hypothetical protein
LIDTPNLPEATCFIALFLESPFISFGNVLDLHPSPELLLPPILFMALQVFMSFLTERTK